MQPPVEPRPRAARVDTRRGAQAVGGVSLDDEMDVIGLNGEMHDAKVLAGRGGECLR